jgi:ATP-dependent RNA helicase DOB1
MANIYELVVPDKNCVHEVATPSEAEYTGLRDPKQQPNFEPAKEYSFKLDSFQERSILCIENEQSVLVSAHTSAGKTVVAEYAIAKSLKNGQRVIYTTPIKALSNQKYREFEDKFKDVGLITGDVTNNPSASCLIMTTEILRQMLFRGNEIMREVGWVIFDEIHYMRDKERGVVWEETIILLPDNVHYVFLSATIPNARQFAEWISYIHHQTCHVVYTDYRPVPLEHHIYAGGLIYKIVDSEGKFNQEKFETAMSSLRPSEPQGKDGQEFKRRRYLDDREASASNLEKVIKAAKGKNFVPIIVFSFSKKECEVHAARIRQELFNDEEDQAKVEIIFNQAIEVLSNEDRNIPQVKNTLSLLKNGVGVHHGGLLPIIKEITEILFGEGLIKVLFATETFAMGLNMPAKTVIFSSVRKFDGKDFRFISSGEFIQMSGRAGRRGLDERGIVILMLDEKIPSDVGRGLLQGQPDPLNSAFHLTYNMVLNLIRVEGVNPDYMLQQSFYTYQNLAKVPILEEEINRLHQKHSEIVVEDEDKITNHVKLVEKLEALKQDYLRIYQRHIETYLNDGRPIKLVSSYGSDLGWGMCLGHQKNKKKKRDEEFNEVSLHALVMADKERFEKDGIVVPPQDGEGAPTLAKFSLSNVVDLSSFRIRLPDDLSAREAKEAVMKTLNSIRRKSNNTFNPMDPVEDLGIRNDEFQSIIKKIFNYEEQLKSLGVMNEASLAKYQEKQQIIKEIEARKGELVNARNSIQMVELKNMKRVLRRLGYCSQSDVIEMKGRVACEITSGDELLLTEMLFNGAFADLTPHQINSLLSCFVFDEKTEQPAKLTEELQQPLTMMQDLAKIIASVSKESGLDIDQQEYIEKFKPSLMDIVYLWSKGASFSEVCKQTDAYEGSIIRCMRRLEELLRQMCQASRVIGNTELENKFSEAITFIKRDIVFAGSLYI